MNFSVSGKRVARVSSPLIRGSIIATYVITAFSAIALTAFNRLYMEDNYIYANNSPVILLVILALVAVASAIYGSFSLQRASRLSSLPEIGTYGAYGTMITSVLITAFFATAFLLYLVAGPYDIEYFTGEIIPGSSLAKEMKGALGCYMATAVFAPFAGIYFIIVAFKKKINALFGSMTLIWMVLYILRLYFDISDWVMSPRKITMICALCIASLFILYELRFAFGRGSSRKYFVFCSLAAVFCSSCGFAGILSVLFNVYPLRFELPYYAICLMLGVYALIRLGSFMVPAKNFVSDNTEAIVENGSVE